MCSASSRPTITSASKIIMQQGAGVKPFFAGVGPRALSNGLNSAVFFCFFEALRGVSGMSMPAKLSQVPGYLHPLPERVSTKDSEEGYHLHMEVHDHVLYRLSTRQVLL